MIKLFKKIAATATAAVMLIPMLTAGSALSQTTSAAGTLGRPSDSREEVVYANLTAAGETKEIYLVAILHNGAAGSIADFGNYASVKNLTDTSPLTLAEDTVTISAPKGDLYYQGTLKSTDLPWNISVAYTLDGSAISADDLAGKNGHVTINIKTEQNASIDPLYFEHYLLQISVTLDTTKCAAITASGATIANAGVNKLVTFAVMPGKPGDVMLETDAVDFSMAGIELSAVPLSMEIDPPDTTAMKDDLQKLVDAVSELDDGISKLESGAVELKNGAEELSSGSTSFAAGLRKLNTNAAGLLGGSAQIKEALTTIATSMSAPSGSLDLGSLQQLPDGLNQLAGGLDGISSGLSELKTGFAASYGALKAALLEIPDASVSDAEWAQLYQNNPDQKDTLDKLAAYYASGVKTKAIYENVRPVFDAMEATLDQVVASVGQISGSLKETAAQIKTALESNDTLVQLGQLTEGLQALSGQYGAFHDGLWAFTGGVSELNTNYSALDSGISGLADGTGQLSDGIGKTSDGVSEMNGSVQDLPEKTDEEIQKLMDAYDNSDMTPVSFASNRNIGTISVQFVMKTDKIEKPAAPAPAPEPEPPETIWTRIADLFK